MRWSAAVPIVLSSIACPAFFSLGLLWYSSTLTLSVLVAMCTLVYRELEANKVTWKLWTLWTCSLFALPLMENPEVLVRVWSTVKGLVCMGEDCSDALNIAAVSGVAIAVEGRRLVGQMGQWRENATMVVPELRVEDVLVAWRCGLYRSARSICSNSMLSTSIACFYSSTNDCLFQRSILSQLYYGRLWERLHLSNNSNSYFIDILVSTTLHSLNKEVCMFYLKFILKM